ncbi:MAG: outer membrane beta-barrel domain-containing protein [Pseudomonadota bacterium]
MISKNLKKIILIPNFFILSCLFYSIQIFADDAENTDIDITDEARNKSAPLEVIDIPSSNVMVGAYFGMLSIEDFGVQSVLGARAGYLINENLFIEADVLDSKFNQTSFESLTNTNLIADEDRIYQAYGIGLGWNILIGEAFWQKRKSIPSALHTKISVGNTKFAGDSNFTLNFAAGYQIFLSDHIGLRFETQDHIFSTDLLGVDKTTHNFQFDFGLNWFI